MRGTYRSILRIAGHVVAGLSFGAVCGFALLSMRFVAANQFPSHRVAMIVVLVAALMGAAVAGIRLWRMRPAPAAAREPLGSRIRGVVGDARATVRRNRAELGDTDRQEGEGAATQQPQLGVGAVPDAA